jgi:hypothetical protein
MNSFFLTCFAVGDDYIEEMGHMVASFREHHPDVPVITGINPPVTGDWWEITKYKAVWLDDTWKAYSHLGDMLWVDADARIRKPIEIPAGDFTIAAKTYSRLATGTLLFRHNPARLLAEWAIDCTNAKDDEEALITACRDLDINPHELPDTMTKLYSEPHEASIVHWNRSRTVDRSHEFGGTGVPATPDWPPSEAERSAL